MIDQRIRQAIRKKFRIADHDPQVKHHIKGPQTETYSYLPWVAELNLFATEWVWLGEREAMLKSLGMDPYVYSPGHRFRFEYANLPPRYFDKLYKAEKYYRSMGAHKSDAVIRDRITGKVVYPEII